MEVSLTCSISSGTSHRVSQQVNQHRNSLAEWCVKRITVVRRVANSETGSLEKQEENINFSRQTLNKILAHFHFSFIIGYFRMDEEKALFSESFDDRLRP